MASIYVFSCKTTFRTLASIYVFSSKTTSGTLASIYVVTCKTMSGTSASYLIRVRHCLGQWHRYEIAYFGSSYELEDRQ
ncbi:Myelin proteolipid [Gossypium arboreum]|uniref:Myelin proteolipid n=1 Tax=Gossypium arboreum TaxID=29729 RepID=A0A0B0PJP4_GOSAR|nr:Myelin proteolipid [Gossypium arboreum]